MTTKSAFQKILKGILQREEEDQKNKENTRKNKPHQASSLANMEKGKSKYEKNNKMTENATQPSI